MKLLTLSAQCLRLAAGLLLTAPDLERCEPCLVLLPLAFELVLKIASEPDRGTEVSVRLPGCRTQSLGERT